MIENPLDCFIITKSIPQCEVLRRRLDDRMISKNVKWLNQIQWMNLSIHQMRDIIHVILACSAMGDEI